MYGRGRREKADLGEGRSHLGISVQDRLAEGVPPWDDARFLGFEQPRTVSSVQDCTYPCVSLISPIPRSTLIQPLLICPSAFRSAANFDPGHRLGPVTRDEPHLRLTNHPRILHPLRRTQFPSYLPHGRPVGRLWKGRSRGRGAGRAGCGPRCR